METLENARKKLGNAESIIGGIRNINDTKTSENKYPLLALSLHLKFIMHAKKLFSIVHSNLPS